MDPAAVNDMVREHFPGSSNECVELGDRHALARTEVRPEAIRPGNYVSGPTQFGAADAALWYLVFAATGKIEPMAVTSELSIRFVRPAQGAVLWARATLDSVSRRTIVGSVTMWMDDRDDKPTSIAQGTYALPR
jgi:acyl-coenzyme A thioesterase PaaI-like protein